MAWQLDYLKFVFVNVLGIFFSNQTSEIIGIKLSPHQPVVHRIIQQF
jgi:hypothetical protein